MDVFDSVCACTFTPFFLIYGIYEIYHGIKSLKNKEFHTNPAIELRIWLIRLLRGADSAEEYRSSQLKNPNLITLRGINGIIFGIIAVAGSILLILVLFGIIG